MAQKYGVPIVVTGFEPLDLARGILVTVANWKMDEPRSRTPTSEAFSSRGISAAQRIINEVFEPCDRAWRGIGVIPMSGYRLRDTLRQI